jgi:hypothetical protein
MKATRLTWSTALFAALFVLVAHTTAAAQQTASAAQQVPGAAGVTVPARALPGPRLQPEWRSVQPAFADSSASSMAVAGSNTITVSTIVLVLAVVILVLLIAK